jgi:hypothetical protein
VDEVRVGDDEYEKGLSKKETADLEPAKEAKTQTNFHSGPDRELKLSQMLQRNGTDHMSLSIAFRGSKNELDRTSGSWDMKFWITSRDFEVNSGFDDRESANDLETSQRGT